MVTDFGKQKFLKDNGRYLHTLKRALRCSMQHFKQNEYFARKQISKIIVECS